MEKEPFDAEAAIRQLQEIAGVHDRKIVGHDDLLSVMVATLTRFEGRLYGVEGRLQGVEGRLQGVEGRLERVEFGLERLEAKIDLRFEQMQSDFRAFKEVLLDHGQRIQALEVGRG